MNKTFDKPFREDLGLDVAGFHRIRMGNTVYCVKDNVIYTLNTADELNRVDEATLSAKSWIRRNVNEVLNQKMKYKAHFVLKSRRGYVIEVNGVQYTAAVSSDPIRGLDSYADSPYLPSFRFSSLLVNENGSMRAVSENEVSNPEFQRVFKNCLNACRRTERLAQRFAMNAPDRTAGAQYRKHKSLCIKRSA